MDSDSKKAVVNDEESGADCSSGTVSPVIYIDPAKEAACRKNFDTYVVPVSVIFLVLSTLDRNNVSEVSIMPLPSELIFDQLGNARVFSFDQDLGLHGGQFGNNQTLSSVSTILLEVPWVVAVKRWGA
jgi:hypothetical protein